MADETERIDTRIEWRRWSPGAWHRTRLSSSIALCGRRIVVAGGFFRFQQRDLDAYMPRRLRCVGCERFWPIFQWAVARLRRRARAPVG